jgi:uncharacterized protein GlcG (DUF336 family)
MGNTLSKSSTGAMHSISSVSRRSALQKLGAMGAGAAILVAGQTAASAQDATPSTAGGALMTQDVSLDQAQAAIDAAMAKAAELGTKMNIAILDVGTNLKAFARMDGALLGSIDIALKKARTAALFQSPTATFGPLVQPGQPLYGAEISNGGLITFPGGVPLMGADGSVIGAIGVSGSSVEDDQAVAEAGAAAIK